MKKWEDKTVEEKLESLHNQNILSSVEEMALALTILLVWILLR